MSPTTRRPEGTKTRGKKSLAFVKTSRINKRISEKTRRISLANARARQKAAEINARREAAAIRKGKVEPGTTRTIQVQAPGTATIAPAKTTVTKVRKFRPVEVRAGSSKTFGKERPKGVAAPSVQESALQAKLARARSRGEEFVTHNGQRFRAGTASTLSVSKTKPATTISLPGISKTVVTPKAVFKHKIPKQKKRQVGGFAVATDARVKRVRIK